MMDHAETYRNMFLGWLREQYNEAVTNKHPLFIWAIDTKKEEDLCINPDGFTVDQIKDEIAKKSLPMIILRVFDTALPFEQQVLDL